MLRYTLKYHMRSGVFIDAGILFSLLMVCSLFNVQYNIALLIPLIFQRTFIKPFRLVPAKLILVKITDADCTPLIRAAQRAYGVELLVAYIAGRAFAIFFCILRSEDVNWVRETAWLLQNIEINIVMLMVGIACSLSDLASIRNEIKRSLANNLLVGLAFFLTSGIICILGILDKSNVGLAAFVVLTALAWHLYTKHLGKLIYYIHFEQ